MTTRNIAIAALMVSVMESAWAGGVFPVATDGDDSRSGGRPFRTIAAAQAAARAAGGGEVRIADGLYELEQPLTLTEADAGIVFAAAPGARPVVSAGRRIANWQVDARGWWHAQVPAGTRSSQFYVDGQRRTRPFLPRQGYHFIAKEANASPEGLQQFYAGKGDLDSRWPNLDEIEVCIFNHWNLARLPLKSVDDATGLATLNYPFRKKICYYSLEPRNWYRLDNVRAALGQPGDWYLGKDGGLVYVPRPGEDPKTAVCTLAVLDAVVKARRTHDVTFRGLVFAHANWNMPARGYHHAQAAADLSGAVDVVHSRNVRLEGCAVIHTGSYAVSFGSGATDCTAVDCEFVDLGAGGVRIGCEWAEGGKAENFAAGCAVENCLVRAGGRVDPAGVGVFIGHGHHCRVSHNTIHDLHYSGVSYGWNWGFSETAHHNLIEWNHIYDIGKRVLSDMGGIYALGRQRGSVERFNHIHDITRARYGAFGIYFDSGSSLITVTNNVVHDCEDCNFYLQTLSAANVVENNIFAGAPRTQLQMPPREQSSQATRFARNIVWWDSGRLFMGVPDTLTAALTNNLGWAVADGEFDPNQRGFKFADPGFVDAEKRDFRFRDPSAAKSIGFVPFSLDGCGRQGEAKLTAGMPPVPDVYFPAPEKPTHPCRENFESAGGDTPWPNWQCMSDAGAPYMRVTEDTAAEGRKSLEVTDVDADWKPHFCDWPSRDKGRHTVSFWWRLGEGARPEFEVRDPDGWCAAPGPWVTVDAQGFLRGRGTGPLVKAPRDAWFKVELTFEVGRKRSAYDYELRVTLPGETSPRVFPKLPVHRQFRKIGWVGFISGGRLGTKYWIDDFRLD